MARRRGFAIGSSDKEQNSPPKKKMIFSKLSENFELKISELGTGQFYPYYFQSIIIHLNRQILTKDLWAIELQSKVFYL